MVAQHSSRGESKKFIRGHARKAVENGWSRVVMEMWIDSEELV